VAVFANLANIRRLLELTRIDMLIMSYGGLRGALAFALALVLDENVTPRKKEFITASIVVVLFTVFVQVNDRRQKNQRFVFQKKNFFS
jgi:NhaP-type Na+/H+ or K+/H+ antiporter